MNSQDVLKGLDSTKFLEILHSNKKPNKFSNRQLKIAFKHPNYVRDLPAHLGLLVRKVKCAIHRIVIPSNFVNMFRNL